VKGGGEGRWSAIYAMPYLSLVLGIAVVEFAVASGKLKARYNAKMRI
jgi:hypothetical protein